MPEQLTPIAYGSAGVSGYSLAATRRSALARRKARLILRSRLRRRMLSIWQRGQLTLPEFATRRRPYLPWVVAGLTTVVAVIFLILAWIYVSAGLSITAFVIYCIIFMVARIAHTICYINSIQPWRTAAFSLGALVTLALIIHLFIRVVIA